MIEDKLYECLICHTMHKRRSLPNHIHSKHHLTAKNYYDTYIEPNIEHLCICGKPTKFKNMFKGYNQHCSTKCSSLDPIVKNKVITTTQEKYGVDHYLQITNVQEKSHSYEARQKAVIKIKQTWNDKYGMHPMQTENCKEKLKATNQKLYGKDWIVESDYFKNKVKENSIKNYGTNWPNQSEQVKQSVKQKNLEKYGVDHYMKDPNKRKNTYKAISKHSTEQECYDYLCTLYKDVKRNYKSDKYPYKCDFYISEKDMYIELHLFIVHGGHKFDPIKDSDKLALLQEKAKTSNFYKRYIDIWTKIDPMKLETAKKNKLNYLVFYSKQDFYNYFNKEGN